MGQALLRGGAELKNLAPTSPQEGPPLPKAMNIKWPWKGEGRAPKVEKGIKIFTGPTVSTPFGRIKLPDAELPPLKLPKIDEQGGKALGHAVGSDLTVVFDFIPYVGDIISDNIQMMHHEQIRQLLGARYNKFVEYEKVHPSAIALLRTYIEE